MFREPPPNGCGTILLALVGLTGCAMPLPGRETTIFDSLPSLQPGQMTSEEVEARYGPPDLKCDNDVLWIYGWSVGKGWLVGMGNGPLAQRLYYTHYIVLVWTDSERRVVRVEVPDTFSSWDFVPRESMCASGDTCVDTRWLGPRLSQDSVVESGGQVLTCKWAWGNPGIAP